MILRCLIGASNYTQILQSETTGRKKGSYLYRENYTLCSNEFPGYKLSRARLHVKKIEDNNLNLFVGSVTYIVGKVNGLTNK